MISMDEPTGPPPHLVQLENVTRQMINTLALRRHEWRKARDEAVPVPEKVHRAAVLHREQEEAVRQAVDREVNAKIEWARAQEARAATEAFLSGDQTPSI